jgi:hypothetical protein
MNAAPPDLSLERSSTDMRPHFALFLVTAGVVAISGCVPTKPAEQSIFEVLPGTWGWEKTERLSCAANSHTLSFSKDRKVMLLTPKKVLPEQVIAAETVRYRVLQSEPNLRMVIEGETRKTATGEPVEWDVRLLSQDRFCWHRADWPPGGCTEAIVRCPSDSAQLSR